MYDSRMLISELEKSEPPKDIGSEFANMCDPFKIIRNPLRSELAISGEAVFINAVEVVSNILEAALEKYKLTID